MNLFSTFVLFDFLQIKVELNSNKQSFDDANPLALPSKKRKTFVKKHATQAVKVLSKKQRKHLEKIVDKKKKNAEVLQI